MQKNKKYTLKSVFSRTGRTAMVLSLALILSVGTVVSQVSADEFDAQIQSLQNENSQASSNVDALQAQADSYQGAIDRLQGQISALQAQIAQSQAEQAKLQQEIIEMQAELDRQRKLLSDDVKNMYVEGEMSAIEMLATSKNLSDFVDKEEYRNAIQKKIQDTLVRIGKLQSDLKQRKVQIDQLVENQKAQEAQLAADRAQHDSMLAYTEAQKNQFTQQIKANTSKIAELKRQQAIANARYNLGSPGVGRNCGGGYPGSAQSNWGTWGCNYEIDNTIDNWGMYNRQCVSYTAFKVHADFLAGRNSRDMPYWGGVGNANQWDDNARRAGIPVDYNPTPGAIAVSNSGYYGHVMYVEQVGVIDGQQAIYVSDYNAGWDGRYREYWRATTGLVFIHF